MKIHHDKSIKSFASDNYAGVHPEVMKALATANGGHERAYGNDSYTEYLSFLIKKIFGEQAEVFVMFNGTGANITALGGILKKYQGVIALDTSHINTDEGNGPERVGGFKIMNIPNDNGKVTIENLLTQAWGFDDVHRAQPGAISITQCSELGTVYTQAEIKVISNFAKENNLFLHLDGARIFNACASLGITLGELIKDSGVDIFTLGGTKNGIMGGEAIVVINPDCAEGIARLRKGSMQLSSKMRFISAQLITLLENDLGIENAPQANKMAMELYQKCKGLKGVTIKNAPEANSVFAIIDNSVRDKMLLKYNFYTWDESKNLVRWMTSWDTQTNDIDEFVAYLKTCL
jgi:threonine aldolase